MVDPRNNTPSYVGITNNPNQRYFEHIELRVKKGKKNDWVQQLLAEGVKPKMRILEIVESREEARAREKYWIQQYVSQGIPLTNAILYLDKAKHSANASKAYRDKLADKVGSDLMTADEVCERIGVQKKQLVYWTKRKYVKSIKLPNNRYYYHTSDIDALEAKLLDFLNK
jgi:predicted GIY-YIG superfamily endonuclease